MSEFKSTNREEFICISYYDIEDLPIDKHCIKYRNIKYDIQEVLERTDDIDYVISDSKTTRNLLKENDKLKEEIKRLNNIIDKKEQFLGDNIKRLEKEVVKRDNIINELEKWLEDKDKNALQDDNYCEVLDKLQELKGSGSNE